MPTKKEWIFYATVGATALLNELAIHFGVYLCSFLPLMFGVLAVGFWAFPKKEN